MSEKSSGAKYPRGRTDTLIGAGMRVEGTIAFKGVLHIQGEALGDISGDSDAQGMIVVGKSGKTAGSLKAPHIVVSGSVSGPVQSSQSIEIQQGACVAGDARYKAIEIHPGGIIEGALTPVDAPDGDRLPLEEHRVRESSPAAAGERGMPTASSSPGQGFSARRKLGAAVALLVAVVAAMLASRGPQPVTPSAADVTAPSGAAAVGTSTPAVAPDGAPPDDAKVVGGNAATAAPTPDVNAGIVVNAPSAGIPEVDGDTLVTIQGVNPAKPAGVFLAIGKEASVLFRKKRQDSTEGTRIDIARGATESIAIARNDVFRVAQGRDLTIFYQGRKVPPKTIESGAWMSFVPQAPGAAERN